MQEVQDGGEVGGSCSQHLPEPNLEVNAKLGNIHPQLLTGDYLKRKLLTKDHRSHIKIASV